MCHLEFCATNKSFRFFRASLETDNVYSWGALKQVRISFFLSVLIWKIHELFTMYRLPIRMNGCNFPSNFSLISCSIFDSVHSKVAFVPLEK